MSSLARFKDPTVPKPPGQLPRSWKRKDLKMLHIINSLLRKHPSVQLADVHQHTVWLLDSTAYQLSTPKSSGQEQPSWRAEIVACIFKNKSRKDMSNFVATIADLIGLDGEVGTDTETHHRIAERLQPFLYHTAPAHFLTLEISLPDHTIQIHELGPTDRNGISSGVVNMGAQQIQDGTTIRSELQGWESKVSMDTFFAVPEGWLVISDIDDTIKHTKTSESTGILRTTFAEEPRPIPGMPRLYARIQEKLVPAWFYVSASPYNLYPFLRGFIHTYFHPGTLMLRGSSWMDVSTLIKSFTTYTMEYKVDRIEKIHQWFPQRRALCIGDSTQRDPEAYAAIYKRYPNWIQGILIRKVTDIPHMEEKNSPTRFEAAFQGIPDKVWRVFERPEEVYRLLDITDST